MASYVASKTSSISDSINYDAVVVGSELALVTTKGGGRYANESWTYKCSGAIGL